MAANLFNFYFEVGWDFYLIFIADLAGYAEVQEPPIILSFFNNYKLLIEGFRLLLFIFYFKNHN